eukprot:1147751-Pelagomonas_calceolata.AAC.3
MIVTHVCCNQAPGPSNRRTTFPLKLTGRYARMHLQSVTSLRSSACRQTDVLFSSPQSPHIRQRNDPP